LFCTKCGTQLNEGSVFCSRCGGRAAPVAEQAGAVVGQSQETGEVYPKFRPAATLLFCTRCGTQLTAGSAFCSRCGTRVSPVTEQVAAVVAPPQATGELSPKSRLAATLLSCPWLIVGLFGAHRFYIGKIGTAVIMLLLGVASVICQLGAMSVAIAQPDEPDPPPLFVFFWLLSGVFLAAAGIWALVDFIIAASGNFKDRQGKPIKNW
jgi:uncharacterized Zn finger protein (UPF0148 family)